MQMRTGQGRGCICSVALEDGGRVLLESTNSRQSIVPRSFKFGMFNHNRKFGKNYFLSRCLTTRAGGVFIHHGEG
jgi:hypothetical protein